MRVTGDVGGPAVFFSLDGGITKLKGINGSER